MNTRLQKHQIMNLAPAVYGTPKHTVSRKYVYVPTFEILELLEKEGFYPVRAEQTGRVTDKTDWSKHMIRLRHQDYLGAIQRNDLIPEICIINSHDAKSTLHVLAGIFKVLCSNGLVVANGEYQKTKFRHFGNAEEVVDTVFDVVKQMPKILDSTNEMQAIELKPDERGVYANAALALKWPIEKHPNILRSALRTEVLIPRRREDTKRDLWTTFNVVQENLVKGGVRIWKTEGKKRRVKSKKVTAINEDLRLNKALWILTEEMKQIKSGRV